MTNNNFQIVADGKRFAVLNDGVCFIRFDDKVNAELYIREYDNLKTMAEFDANEADIIKRLDSYVFNLQDEYGYEFHEWSETVPWIKKAIGEDIYLAFGKGKSTVSLWVMLKDGKVNIRFNAKGITVKHYPEGPEAEAKAAVQKNGDDEARETFEKYAEKFGLKKTDFGREFQVGEKKYKICGILPKSKKNQILLECNGKQYKATANIVVSYLNAA